MATVTALVNKNGFPSEMAAGDSILGTLVDFTDVLYSTGVNATVPVAALSATGTATNIDIALVPKGTGAIVARIADGASTGGNKRGANAVDLQTYITAATQVASGGFSFCEGSGNTASSGYAIAMGLSNTASAGGAIAMGRGNSASGLYSVAMGYNNTASGAYSIAMGIYASTRGISGASALGCAALVAAGRCKNQS